MTLRETKRRLRWRLVRQSCQYLSYKPTQRANKPSHATVPLRASQYIFFVSGTTIRSYLRQQQLIQAVMIGGAFPPVPVTAAP